MRTCIFSLMLILLSSLAAKNATHAAELPTTNDQLEIASTDWPWWRGPLRNGTASAKQTPPTEFSTSKNLIWKAPIPGRGHGSPTVVGGQVFVATANEQIDGQQSLLCFDRQTGEPQWSTVVHASGGMQKNNKATAASSTPACDGQRVYINFPNNGGLYTSALSLTGELLWQERISDYVVHQGYGASPCLYQNLVIVTSDNKTGGAIAALDSKSGEMVWRRERPATRSAATIHSPVRPIGKRRELRPNA